MSRAIATVIARFSFHDYNSLPLGDANGMVE
jgi:hypothetical protein